MKKHKVLLVDDEPNVTEALKRALRRESYEIFTATSARDALKVLERTEIDVVISDEQMPEMSGSQFLAIVCDKYPHTIRIILTGQASLEAAVRAINEGQVYRFLNKPCNEVDLKVTVRQALLQKDLALQSRRLLREYQKQGAAIEELERRNPGIGTVETDDSGAILVDVEGDTAELLEQIANEIDGRVPSAT